MDPHSFIARAEAQRWLGIAEKLLMGRDLVGSKTFAIRARESDPRLEAADQILAVTDTLLAAEKRVGPGNNQPDWYAILQLVRLTQDTELIAGQYRRLALLLNPHKNLLPYADQAYQLVSDAWSVLSNPMRKNLYDNELNFGQIGFNQLQQPPPPPHHNQPPPQPPPQQHQQHNFFSHPNPIGSSREPERVQVVQEQPFMTRFPQQQQPPPPQQQQQQQQVPLNFLSQTSPIGQTREQEHARPFQIKVSQPQPRAPPPQQPQWKQPPPQEARPSPRPQQPQQAPQQQQPPPPPPPQQQQQQQAQERHSTMPAPRQSDNGVREMGDSVEGEMDAAPDGIESESSSFWTACPFCFNMYEYPRVYADCTMRCVNCKRAFQAVVIPSPPEIVEGKEAYFCCWGFFPLGVSMPHLEKNKGKGGSSWAPCSPLYVASPHLGDMSFGRKKRHWNAGKNAGPRIYIDDYTDDVFVGISEPSDDSDVEWGSSKRKKKVRRVRKKRGPYKKKNKLANDAKVKDVGIGNGENLQDGFTEQEGAAAPNVPVAETSKKVAGSNPRRLSGRVAKELGKLDLNVEFNNNEGEEPAPGMTAGNRGGHGEEDNIEGIGFFEGLDEFLSSLPILSVVGDDKVKAA